MSAQKGGELGSIQCLRAMAALLVVTLHASQQLDDGALAAFEPFGNFGVDLFFVISGFIMFHVSRRGNVSPAGFLRNRVIRIAPMYWFYTGLAVVIYLAAPSVFRASHLAWDHAVLSLLFIAHPNPALADSVSPFLRLGWTLNYEMFFYAILAGAMLVAQRWSLLVTAIALTSAPLIGLVLSLDGIVTRFYTSTMLFEFVLGLGLGAVMSRRAPRLGAIYGLLLIVAALGGVFLVWGREDLTDLRGFLFGPPAALIVFAFVSLERLLSAGAFGWWRAIGDASYTIYLMHLFPLSAFRFLWTKLGLPGDSGMFAVVVVPVVVGLGWCAYKLIEAPTQRALRAITGRRSAASAPGSAHTPASSAELN